MQPISLKINLLKTNGEAEVWYCEVPQVPDTKEEFDFSGIAYTVEKRRWEFSHDEEAPVLHCEIWALEIPLARYPYS